MGEKENLVGMRGREGVKVRGKDRENLRKRLETHGMRLLAPSNSYLVIITLKDLYVNKPG